MPGFIKTRSPWEKPDPLSTTPAPSAPRIRGLGADGRPLRTHRSMWLSEVARSRIRTSSGPGTGSGASSYRSTSGPPSSWMRIAFTTPIFPCNRLLLSSKELALRGTMSFVTTGELERIAAELGIDVVGAAPAEAYESTERHIAERKERGLFADMRFTMARPE